MQSKRFARLTTAGIFLAAIFVATAAQAAGVKMQFFGNQHFRFVSPGGKVILIKIVSFNDWHPVIFIEPIRKIKL